MRLHINAVGAVIGGGARHLPPFVAALSEARPSWELVAYVSCGAPDIAVPGVRLRRIPRQSGQRIVWDSVSVGLAAGRGGADVLLNLANYGPVRSPVPSILYERNSIYFDPTWVRAMTWGKQTTALLRRRLAFAQMRRSAAVVVPSNAMAAYLRSWRAYPTDVRVEVIPHAVDVARFAFKPTTSRGRVRIVSLSHAYPHKGQEVLIDMIGEIRSRGVDAYLEASIADEDNAGYVARLRQQVRAAGLDQHVRFVGRVDAARFLSHADIMVLPSITESFGFPIVESMACGVPIVASAIPSTIEVLGHLGWYFPVGDASTAARQVIAVLNMESDSLHTRLLSAQGVAATYSWAQNADRIAHLVEEVASHIMRGGAVSV